MRDCASCYSFVTDILKERFHHDIFPFSRKVFHSFNAIQTIESSIYIHSSSIFISWNSKKEFLEKIFSKGALQKSQSHIFSRSHDISLFLGLLQQRIEMIKILLQQFSASGLKFDRATYDSR